MLGAGRYLLGIAELALLVGFAWLGAASARRRLLPRLGGAPAALAGGVIALALALWVAEALGTVSLFEPLPYLLGMAAVGAGLWAWGRRRAGGGVDPGEGGAGSWRDGVNWVALAAMALAALALAHFAGGVRTRLLTGMTGFDSTWYHGPFAAGFFQTGNTIDLHFIAPQFLAWFYPANGEIFHAAGMLAFGRDILSPLLNLGWFAGCLLAAWCIGRPFRVAPWSLALAAIALSVPALADQAGEARNDIVGIFFLLAAVAVALNAWDRRDRGLGTGALVVTGLAAGLAAGTKLNFLLPAAVLVVGLVAIAPRGHRRRALATAGLAALAGGGYWYLRNLLHTGNPLPWVHHLGPISLPAPAQGLGGREAHSVLGYLTDGSVWSNWFLPGLHAGLWIIWPLLGLAALSGLLLSLIAPFRRRARSTSQGRWAENTPIWWEIGPSTGEVAPERVLALAGAVGLAAGLAWLVSPTSASGPDGMPHGFQSGLRYLAPALVLGLALLPATPFLRRPLSCLARARQPSFPPSGQEGGRAREGRGEEGGGWRPGRRLALGVGAAALLLAVAVGYPVQRHYLRDRYAHPTFTTPGLDAAFRWARGLSGARIATNSTRQYPLLGTDLSNRVDYLGTPRPHGGFEEITTCRAWREALDAGEYDYVVVTYDRIGKHQPTYPLEAAWGEGPKTKIVLKEPPTVVLKLNGPLDPSACPS